VPRDVELLQNFFGTSAGAAEGRARAKRHHPGCGGSAPGQRVPQFFRLCERKEDCGHKFIFQATTTKHLCPRQSPQRDDCGDFGLQSNENFSGLRTDPQEVIRKSFIYTVALPARLCKSRKNPQQAMLNSKMQRHSCNCQCVELRALCNEVPQTPPGPEGSNGSGNALCAAEIPKFLSLSADAEREYSLKGT